MKYPLCSDDNRTEFVNNGYLHIKQFFDLDSCLAICEALDSLDPSLVKAVSSSRSTYIDTTNHSNIKYFGLTYLQKASLFIPEICGVKNLALLNFSAELLGVSDAFFLEDEVHVRQSILSHEIPAHQDNFYFALRNPTALTCYVYLTNQDRNSGGLGFLPSPISRTTDDHVASKAIGFSSYNKLIEHNCVDKFEYPITCAGDVIFHHSNTYHRAFSNAGCTPTASLSVRVFSNANLAKSESILAKYTANLLNNRS